MRIYLFHQYFKHPSKGGATRSYYLAKKLVDEGHEVHVFTAHNGRKLVDQIDGFQVSYAHAPYENHFGFGRRVWAYLQFAFKATSAAIQAPKPALNYIISTPLTTGIIALFHKKIRKIAYCFEVGDLWPEVPVQMGVINNFWLKKLLYAFERLIYLNADKIVALSPPIKDYIEYSCDFKVSAAVIPNMANCHFFTSKYDNEEFSEDHKFQISYIGTMGVANHLQSLLSFAKACQEQLLPVQFNLMGSGATQPALQEAAKELHNVSFLPPGTHPDVRDLLDQTHAVYVSFKKIPILNTGSPNKFFDGLAAGKLIIVNFEGWIKKLVEQKECGFYYDPQLPEKGVASLIPFLKSPLLLIEFQENARKLAEMQFSTETLSQKWIEYVSR